MMKHYEIEIEIAPNGDIKAIVKGVKGSACRPLSAWLDELGIVTDDRDTPEMQQRVCIAPIRQQVGGNLLLPMMRLLTHRHVKGRKSYRTP